MKISVQSLFEDYEDDTVELRRDADTARILEKTMAKLPNARKKRPLRLVLIAAAAVAVLCGAAAIVHYASVEPAEQPYTLKSVFRDVDGTTIRQDIDFTQDGAVTFDTDGKTEGFFCGISQHPQQVNGVDAGLTSTLYESLSYADQYEGQHFLSSLSDEEKQQAKELVTCINYHDKVSNDDCSVECLSANDVAGVALLLWGRDTTPHGWRTRSSGPSRMKTGRPMKSSSICSSMTRTSCAWWSWAENGKSARQWPRNSRSFRPTFPHRNATGTSSGSARWDKRCAEDLPFSLLTIFV